MASLVRWRTRANINLDCHRESTRPARQIKGPTRRFRRRNNKCRWPAARTAFNWLAYQNRNQSLRLLRRTRVHVDTTLRTSDGFTESVHWQVISALCPKLLEHSTIDCDHSRGTRSYYTIELPESITGPVARLLVECAYGEPELALDKTNLEEFYNVAHQFDMKHAVRVCLDYARTILDVNNCIYLLQVSQLHKHQKLRRAAYAMIRANFKLILHVNKDFHSLDAKHLRQLLLDDSLRINEDEEIAWLAIVRWANGQLLSQSELAKLYNQMVSEPQEVRRTWPISHQQHLQLALMARQSQPELSQALQPQMIRLTLDFYSPANPIESTGGRSRPQAVSKSLRSPLRSAAEQLRTASSQRERREDDLYCLIKSMRFMRFKSVGAFDVILDTWQVKRSTKLTLLVQHMRLRYKLRHKLQLTNEDRQMIDAEELKRIKDRETTRTQRLVKSARKFVSSTLQPPQTTANYGQSQERREAATSLAACQRDHNQAHQVPTHMRTTSAAAAAAQRLTRGLVREQFSAQSIQRAGRPRVPTAVGLLMGGWQDGRVTNSMWAYDFVFDKWFKLNIKMPEARAFHASASSPRGQVYIFGGTDGKAILSSVLRIQPASDVFISSARSGRQQKWQRRQLVYNFRQLRPMNERRCHLSGLFHSDGRLYALGGHNGTQRLRSGEWYDPKSNQWHAIAEMTIARADAAACSHDNKIFIAGGQISDQFIQSSVEFYKSSDNTWTFAAPMIIPRMSFSLASYKGHLLAIGGTNGLMGGEEVASVTRSVERYNHNAGAWAFCAPMLQKRCAFGVMHIENKLLVMGGHGGRRRLKTCESLRIGQFTGQPSSLMSLSAMMSQSLRQRLARLAVAMGGGRTTAQPASSNSGSSRTSGAGGGVAESSAPAAERAADGSTAPPSPQPPQLVARNSTSKSVAQNNNPTGNNLTTTSLRQPPPRGVAARRSLPDLATLAGSQLTATELMRAANTGQLPPPVRSAMKWIPRAKLPERRSGFSIAVVHKLRNAREFTYFGSLKRREQATTCSNSDNNNNNKSKCNAQAKPSFIKQPGRWHKFKIIKRRKLVKHLKIALIVTIVILIM